MSPTLVQTAILFLLLATGFAAGRLRFLDEASSKGLSRFLVNFILPALVISSMQQPFSPALRDEAFLVLGVSFGVYALAFLLAWLLVKVEGAKGGEAGAHAFGAVFTNAIFMGFPVIEAFFGKESLFLASIYNIPFQLLAFSVGAWILAKSGGAHMRLGFSAFVTPAAVAALAGFGLFVGGVAIPEPLLSAARLLGGTTTPLSMVLVGAMLSRMPLRKAVGNPRLYVTSLFRLVLFPATLWLVLKALGCTGLLLGLPVVVAAMPVAANAAILAEAYGGDAGTASSLVFITTVLSVLTIPVLGMLLGR